MYTNVIVSSHVLALLCFEFEFQFYRPELLQIRKCTHERRQTCQFIYSQPFFKSPAKCDRDSFCRNVNVQHVFLHMSLTCLISKVFSKIFCRSRSLENRFLNKDRFRFTWIKLEYTLRRQKYISSLYSSDVIINLVHIEHKSRALQCMKS